MASVVEISEYLRAKMVAMAVTRECLTHPDVIDLSQRLDRYIVQAQKVLSQRGATEPDGFDALSSEVKVDVTLGAAPRASVQAISASRAWDSGLVPRFYPRPNQE